MNRQVATERRLFAPFVIVATVMLLAASTRLTTAAERPNILFIMTRSTICQRHELPDGQSVHPDTNDGQPG
jgi:hypothetical protein